MGVGRRYHAVVRIEEGGLMPALPPPLPPASLPNPLPAWPSGGPPHPPPHWRWWVTVGQPVSRPSRPWTRSRNTLPPVPPSWTFSSTPAAAVSLVAPPLTLPRYPGSWTCPRLHTPWSGPEISLTGLPPSWLQAAEADLPRGWLSQYRDPPGNREGRRGTYFSVHNDGETNKQDNNGGLNWPSNVLFMTCNAQTIK